MPKTEYIEQETEAKTTRRTLLSATGYLVFILCAAILFSLIFIFSIPGSGVGVSAKDGLGTGMGNGTGDGIGDGHGNGQSGTERNSQSQAQGRHGTGKDAENRTGTSEKETPVPVQNPTEGNAAGQQKAQASAGDNSADSPSEAQIAMIQSPDDGTDQTTSNANDGFRLSGSKELPGGRDGFFGEKIGKIEDVLFIVDVSYSMGSCMTENMDRITVLKIQLKNAIQSGYTLRSRGKYAILAFWCGHEYFPKNEDGEPKMFRFDNLEQKKKTDSWIDQHIRTSGGTDLYSAISFVKDVLEKKLIRLDTIHILTDGEVGNEDAILSMLQGKEFKEIKIHTVSIGRSSDLLRKIAIQNKGKYREFK